MVPRLGSPSRRSQTWGPRSNAWRGSRPLWTAGLDEAARQGPCALPWTRSRDRPDCSPASPHQRPREMETEGRPMAPLPWRRCPADLLSPRGPEPRVAGRRAERCSQVASGLGPVRARSQGNIPGTPPLVATPDPPLPGRDWSLRCQSRQVDGSGFQD